jgi:putative acetyltransferase
MIHIIDWQPQYQQDWRGLNLDWISKDYEVEPIDLETLDYPDKYFFQGGGAILLAQRTDTGEIVGTVGLQPFGNGVLELCKMTVAENARGLHIGEQLGVAALERARTLGATKVFLLSNAAKAYQAINLYYKLGFRCVALNSTEFKRATIQMEICF